MPIAPGVNLTVDKFLTRWTDREGGAERANYVMFLTELCELIGVGRPDPAGTTTAHNDYVFERAVRPRDSDDIHAPKRIDLYKKGCFILEAKQSRLAGGRNDLTRATSGQSSLPLDEPVQLGRRGTGAKWDAMMRNARQQGERYVFLLEKSQPVPPFLIVCDVGHCIELYADFSGTGRDYTHFPDRNGFRIYLEDLRKPEMRERLKAVWTDPASLDPTKHAAKVTREIAKRLAEVSKALEANGANAEDVAHFLMRCLFTMFAENVGLLPEESFKTLLEKSVADPTHFGHRLKSLWKHMDEGEDYSFVIDARVRRFNGGLFKNTTVFELKKEEIGELLAAARYSWKEVDPAIFGTLLEQALDKTERRKLGAHYTPRAYVQRLVDVTIMEPLRADWQAALTRVEQAKDEGDNRKAVAAALAFHRQLCATRVLDPACGTGNFLYVSLELMKRLEGEVLEVLAKLGLETLGLEEVDPNRFLGLEINPRAAAIAELVIWIGYLQQHYRTHTGHPSEPILKDFKNINFGLRGGYDAVLTWDGYPLPTYVNVEGKTVATYPRARQPAWPEAEFIVGNPPFIGKGDPMREALGDAYLRTLWSVHKPIDASSDFVMFWWDRAADLLKQKKSCLKQFGLVSTNSISQVFNRRTIERHVGKHVSIVMAIPNQAWLKADKEAAQVRIAMTVVARGIKEGTIHRVLSEKDLDSDTPSVVFEALSGLIHADLSVGVDVTKATKLKSNFGLSSNGVLLAGRGFIIEESKAAILMPDDGKNTGYLRRYVNGRALKSSIISKPILDFSEISVLELRSLFPNAYQHLFMTVKSERDSVYKIKGTPDSKEYAERWWQFAKPRRRLKDAISNIPRFIATNETTKFRYFQFLDASILPDHMIVAIASADGAHLAICSSRVHVLWANKAGGRQGVGNDPRYTKSRTIDPFPFPNMQPRNKIIDSLESRGEELDAHRKQTLMHNPDLSITEIYNVFEKN